MSKKTAISYIAIVMMCIILAGCNKYDMSGNGRDFRVTFPEGLILQADPPKSKLVNFMNEKYGIKFKQYEGTEFSESGFRFSHTSAQAFDRYYNGIIVSTDEYPEHYFFVCDYYGVIHDDYGCHQAELEAEQFIESHLSEVIDDDYKVILHPNFFQEHIFAPAPTGMDYLEHGEYIIRIYISDNGGNSEEQFKTISEIVAPYWDGDCFMYIYYVDDSIFNSISADDYNSYSDLNEYNKMGQGRGWIDDNIHSWEWYTKE